jgi:hypothetical protein
VTEKTTFNYKPFRDLAELRDRRVISREHFILNWGLAQKDQCITPQAWCGKDRRK